MIHSNISSIYTSDVHHSVDKLVAEAAAVVVLVVLSVVEGDGLEETLVVINHNGIEHKAYPTERTTESRIDINRSHLPFNPYFH